MNDKIAGCLFGTAIGDALAAPVEFLAYEDIRQQYPPSGPLEPKGDPAKVTDDTQMALAVGEAAVKAPRPFTPETLADAFKTAFIDWFNDPENNRAPGSACLNACERLVKGADWHEAGDISSKGSGANMRVMAVGLLNVDAPTRAGIAQLQAAITHAHPVALAAADLTAFVIAELRDNQPPRNLARNVRSYAHSQRDVYHEVWLGDLWQRAYMMPDEKTYINYGWDECLHILDKLDAALIIKDDTRDPCEATGAGWVAEEAFGTALLCFLLNPEDAISVIRRAAFTSGDSDSIAAIAGAFAGAYHGIGGFPADWVARVEYNDRLTALATALS